MGGNPPAPPASRPTTRPGPATANWPGSGNAAYPVEVPIESTATCAVGPPPSTGVSVAGALGMVRVILTPPAAAEPLNAGGDTDGCAPADRVNPMPVAATPITTPASAASAASRGNSDTRFTPLPPIALPTKLDASSES